MISIDEHHEAIACVSDIDLVIKPGDNLDHNNNNNPLPNFSIRDYVYASRCKNIACNWPFSSENLQLCLKSGVKNLLPPFESLDSLRIYSYIAKNRVPDEETVTILDSKSTDNRIISVASSRIKSQCHFEEKLSQVKSISQPAVMKSNSAVDLVNDIITATKVCPVCKTFTSSSNNTLNAHIDRCLSGESSLKSPESCPKMKTFKHRIKPRNTRLMLDIYKTAKPCTIEELDRRNGTNWATSSSFPDQELEFEADENKNEPRELKFVPEISEHEDHEGDVYIDKNGTKVRILSTLNFSNLDDNEARMLQKGEKKIYFVKKKTKKGDVQKRRRKTLKLSPSSSKILCKKINKKIVDKQVMSGEEENAVIEKSCNKEDEGEKRMKTQERKRMDDLAITRPPWACSKRSGVTKKRKFQDSLKQKSSMEENVSEKLSFGLPVNDMGAKKKKSVTSISSNENYSSGRFEITSESAGIDQVPFLRSFTGLKNSMDEEFSNMVDDDNENRGSYFQEVDPIPIPGPPGSFLPLSPFADDMVSEEDEIQGNSSLTTTSRVLSSDQDHNRNDITNRDVVSDSPISNVSSPAPQDTKSANSSDHLRSVVGIFTEKRPNPNHCRCSIKDGADHRESREFERVFEANTRPNGLNFRPESLSLTLPQPQAFKSPADLSVNIPVSPTTPVLRLMGKNLIVVNTDDEKFMGSSPMGHNPFRNIQNENHGSMTSPNFARSFSDLRLSRANGLMAPANCSRFDTKMEISAIDDLSENEAGDHMFYDYMRRNQAPLIMHESHIKQQPLMSHIGSSSACYRRSFSIPTAQKEDI